MTEPTRKRLAHALRNIPGMPPALIEKATEGYYDDYLSPLAMPQLQLVNDVLWFAKQPTTGPHSRDQAVALVRAVMDGEYDGTKEEADAWASSQEGRDAFNSLLRPED